MRVLAVAESKFWRCYPAVAQQTLAARRDRLNAKRGDTPEQRSAELEAIAADYTLRAQDMTRARGYREWCRKQADDYADAAKWAREGFRW